MNDCNTVHVPMENRLKLSKKSTSPPVDASYYRSIVGSLRYLVHTRPDISFAVRYVSRFMENPTTEHLSAIKHILRYIAGMLHFGLSYTKGQGEIKLKGYSDADMAGDVDDCKSTTGVLFCFGDAPVTWQSQKQPVVALSSCEVEYIAASTAACQGLWLGSLLGRFYGKSASVATIFIDNQSAIQLCKNPVFHGRSKHIKTRFHFIKECVEGGDIIAQKIHTDDQLADILTKSLGRVRFLHLRSKIGVVNILDN
ncbi:secreted RxLR effector protein 161-like [Phragmites australis]|uniref:secreted RxLR effector protein 161-like n=1 Tax=Phragmites australis TaxID=29695 RepID=UPI002D782204|nr:secreted RxLR effector protein 161-like [Phragmites australis]